MDSRLLLAGPQYSQLETVAFERLAGRVGDQPKSVLFLAGSDHVEAPTRERWQEFGPRLSLTVESFDSLVAHCFEQESFTGYDFHVDEPLRDRLVELAIERLQNAENPLAGGSHLPGPGLCDHVEELLSLMEFADLHSSTAIRSRLRDEGLEYHAETVPAVAAAFEEARGAVIGDAGKTLRAERYRDVLESETALSEYLPSVEYAVLGGFSLFSPLERKLVDGITASWPTVALLPQMVDADEPVGIDCGGERALSTYRALGFEREYVTPAVDREGNVATAQAMYRPADVETAGSEPPDIELIQPETIPQELRYVGRDIRARIADGTPPEDIGIVLADAGTYQETLLETLERYEVPVALGIDREFAQTAIGGVVEDVTTLAREDPPIDSMTSLLSNPLVSTADEEPAFDHDEFQRVASHLTSHRLEPAYNHLDSETADVLRSIVDEAQVLRSQSLDAFPERLYALLETLGVSGALDDLPRSPRGTVERQAADRLDRTLETLAMTAGQVDTELGDAVDRLERALTGATFDAGGGGDENRVLVCPMSEAFVRSFDRTYVLGLTSEHVSSNPDRPFFFQSINEAHEDFEQADVQQRTRYYFGLQLCSPGSLLLSVPERSLEGDPYVEADVVSEFRRVSGLDPLSVTPGDVEPGCYEDVQRSLATTFETGAVDEYEPLVDRAAADCDIDTNRRRRAHAGVACGAARASDALSPHDGQLSPETVAELHGTEIREPFSPSRLETYAACGYKYYMGTVLDIDEPDDIGLEPDARDRGGYLHDVLEHYYADLQSKPGDPVAIGGGANSRESHLLEVALERLDEYFETDETAFHHEWLVGVLAGLGTPMANPYHGSGRHDAPEEGLLVRFLEHEREKVAKTTVRPAWFEARIGRSRYGRSIREEPAVVKTPAGEVSIHGMIDRVDVVPWTSPTQIVVRDYKTGGTPSESDTLGGISFQLPIYAHLLEDLLDDVETVGGAYYQVKPPREVDHRKGLVASRDHATWHDADDVSTPLLRYNKPTFETHDAFRRFVDETVPERLGELSNGVGEGHFQPTVLTEDDAGCEYCGYSDVCDVRPHRRHDVIDGIDAENLPVYVPLTARGDDPGDVLEVE